MQLETKQLILRDFIPSDVEKRMYWRTEATEWQLWDGPWHFEGMTEEQRAQDAAAYRLRMEQQAEEAAALAEGQPRQGFQIVERETGAYIGWLNSYYMDDGFNIVPRGPYLAVGIDIPEPHVRNKGYGRQALAAFLRYLEGQGHDELYLQTWSGNTRMIHVAEKLGFEECRRKPGLRQVRGGSYDGLTFRLNLDQFHQAAQSL